MNRQGFTLIEMLSTITIMTLIATVASINMIKIFDSKETLSKESKVEIIEEAACVYIELDENKNLKENCLNEGCEITTDTLIKSGLLDEYDVDKSIIINIYKENNEKKCVIK